MFGGDKMNNLSSTKDLKRTLGFWDLMGAAIGQIIGAGIMSLTGVAIGMTGRTAPLAFVLSAIMVLISWYPLALINTTARFRGGQYSIILICTLSSTQLNYQHFFL